MLLLLSLLPTHPRRGGGGGKKGSLYKKVAVMKWYLSYLFFYVKKASGNVQCEHEEEREMEKEMKRDG